MINKDSLLAYLRTKAKEQCARQFALNVQNPHRYSVEEVCSDFELFILFSDPDAGLSEESWRELKIADRIRILDQLGRLRPVD